MSDLSQLIKPRSDQLNADDLVTGSKTIKITKVVAKDQRRQGEQPISIYFEGDNNKPYKPGLAMTRVLVQAWGTDGDAYVGRMLTLYRDEEITFGGQRVGGIRISHMSHIDGPRDFLTTVSKASRRPFRVLPLETTGAPQQKSKPSTEEKKANAKTKADAIVSEIAGSDDVMGVLGKHKDTIERLRSAYADLAKAIDDAAAARQAALTTETTDKLTQPALIDDDRDKR